MKYTEGRAVEKLKRNNVRIEEKTGTNAKGETIFLNYIFVNAYSIGIKLWGAIDFLHKVHHYIIVKEKI